MGRTTFIREPPMNRSSLLLRVALLGAAFPPALAPAAPAKTIVKTASTNVAGDKWKAPLAGDQKILNALNRLTFGPRPGDVEMVKKVGLNRWIQGQLNPAQIDDKALESALKPLSMLNATPETLMLAYSVQKGNVRRALERMNREEKGVAAKPNVKEVVLNERDQRDIKAFQQSGMEMGASQQALGELTAAKLARAVDSKRQLQEVLVDFWGNHFNLDINKGPVQVLKVIDDRDTIRPNVFGTFRQLLGASAHSPAMMWYLDNAKSTVEYANKRNSKKSGGLNENYGREIMELHTLGVEGGYTQQDVTEVARCFTGWGIARGGGGAEDSAFRFNARAHDNGEKTVLGHVIPAGGGEQDGEMVLDILAAHPATARHIAFQLCQRFIADAPPQSAVDAVAAAFTRSNGDLKATYAALFATPEFNSAGAYRAKIKSPLEFAVSAVRALDGSFALPDPDNERQRLWLIAIGRSARDRNARANLPRRPLAVEIAAMGQPLWGYQAPTGYSENSQSWVSSSALISRLNFALALTTGRIGDVALEKDTFRNTAVKEVAANLLSEPLSAPSQATIEDEIKTTPGDGAKVRALILGSPEFQRR